MRTRILAGNWKMNFTKTEALAFIEGLSSLKSVPGTQMHMYAPALFLDSLACAAAAKQNTLPLYFGAQNCFSEKSGAFTGEWSATQLQSIDIHRTLVGHSERRQFFGDTDEVVLKKCQSLTSQGLDVLVCVGETLAERESGKTWDVLTKQLSKLVSDPALKDLFGKKLNIAYEPVWAIGTGKTASPEQAEEVHAWIRDLLQKNLGTEIAGRTSILYGGSVSPANFADLMKCPNIDGGLVGGASLKLESWTALWNLLA